MSTSQFHSKCQTSPPSPSRINCSDAQKPCSSHLSSESKFQALTNWLSSQSPSATSTSEEVSTKTSSCQVEQPCSRTSQRDSTTRLSRESRLDQPLRSKLPPKESSWSGLVVQSCPACRHSSPCGSPSKNIMKLVQASSTASQFDRVYNGKIIFIQ